MRWKRGSWYTLCAKHFKQYRNEGLWCKADRRMKCSLCPNKAKVEFYPDKRLRMK